MVETAGTAERGVPRFPGPSRALSDRQTHQARRTEGRRGLGGLAVLTELGRRVTAVGGESALRIKPRLRGAIRRRDAGPFSHAKAPIAPTSRDG